MAIIREFNLHTNAGPSIPPVIHVNQYDRGETWKFKLYQPNGQQLTPTDAAIVGIKSDGHIIANAGTVSGGVISITETEQMTAAPGKAVFEILFDNDTHGTANFIVLVEPSPTEGGIASDSDLSLFQEAIDSISPATINAAVSAWMSAQLTPSEWVIDNSLTVANAAADAKKAGDLIRQNTADIGDLAELVTEDQSSLVGAINETKTDLYNWFTEDIEKVKYIYEGSGSDADIYEVRRLEWDAANDADITGLKVITRKEGASADTSKFFVDGNELMEYVIGDTSDLSGTITEEISDLKNALTNGVPYAVKQALDNILQNVAFKNNDVYTSDLATVHTWATSVNVTSISAIFTQGDNVIYDTDSLDSLKQYLVVTANYDNGTTATLSDSAYTLSGTLTAGTSIITVAYSEKTTTFNVTVTSEKPTEYTWLYDYTDGLLSEQSYVTMSKSGTASETISDDALYLHTVKSNNNLYYGFTDETATNAILTAKIKLSGFGLINTNDSGTGGFRLQLSNGASGAQAYFLDIDTLGNHRLAYYEGSTRKYVDITGYNWSDYHIVEVKLQNGSQIISIDGDELVNTSTLSTTYCTVNRIMNQSGRATGQDTDAYIKWIAYYEVS